MRDEQDTDCVRALRRARELPGLVLIVVLSELSRGLPTAVLIIWPNSWGR